MSKDEALALIDAALRKVDPEWQGSSERSGNLGVRIDGRGDVFDVHFSEHTHLDRQYEDAIREALGNHLGRFRIE